MDSKLIDSKIESVQDLLETYQHDSEQDFNSWVEKIKTPDTNENLGATIQKLHSNVESLNTFVNSNTSIRQLSVEIGQTMKKM